MASLLSSCPPAEIASPAAKNNCGTALKSPQRKRILVVDEHPMTRLGIIQRLRVEHDLFACCEAGTAQAALAIVSSDQPNLVITGLAMPDRNGLELIKDLHTLHPKVPVLVFSMHHETLYAERVLRAGARGYLMKNESPEMLLAAVRCVLAGRPYLSPLMQDRAVHRFAHGPATADGDNTAALSDRELEVFELIGQGLATRQITIRLHVSTSTVETHRAHIKVKLNLHSAPELVHAAVEWVTRRPTGI